MEVSCNRASSQFVKGVSIFHKHSENVSII